MWNIQLIYESNGLTYSNSVGLLSKILQLRKAILQNIMIKKICIIRNSLLHNVQRGHCVICVILIPTACEKILISTHLLRFYRTAWERLWALALFSLLRVSLGKFSNLAMWHRCLLAGVTHFKIQQCVDLALKDGHPFQQLLYRHGPHHSLSSEM